ncbi:unnamed protein product [Sphagnum balticum]
MAYPLNAWSIEEYERLTSGVSPRAEFRKPGAKDKKKRKSHMGLGAKIGIGAGGVAGAGALSAGIRYGGAEIGTRRAKSRLQSDEYKTMSYSTRNELVDRSHSGGASGQAERDVESVKKLASELPQKANRLGQTTSELAGKAWSHPAGKIGAGVAALGAVGGAGYAGYRALNGGKKKRSK